MGVLQELQVFLESFEHRAGNRTGDCERYTTQT